MNRTDRPSTFTGWLACRRCRGTGSAAELLPGLPIGTRVPRELLRRGDQRRLTAEQQRAAALTRLELDWRFVAVPCRVCRGRGGRSC
jgi:hypothetical protein